jgi:D-alanyl-lipoteichoic acid acyltransferase DltB (MBOAT superfamily)
MEITSLTFAGFVALVFLIYHFLPLRAQNFWLLLTSLLFYVAFEWQFAVILLILTLLNFTFGKGIAKSKRQGLLWIGIVLNAGALLVFKYADFYIPALTELLNNLGIQTQAGGLQILLPIGLSFYIVQAISYLLDVYRDRTPAEEDPLNFTLYFLYFPKLVSGPIERARDFLPKLREHRLVDNALLTSSLSLIVVGMVRKIVFADTLTVLIPEDAFTEPMNYPGQFLVVWLLTYAFALYNDFAGYTNIVRGVSGLLGIELSANFMRPYFARNFTEFWQRWHISLSEWLRDYVFFPSSRALIKLVPTRQHAINIILPPMMTMLVSGLWHGVSWHMLVWGGLHGLYQVIERLISLGRPVVPPDERPWWRQGLAMSLVFALAVVAWVPFRMELATAMDYVRGIVTPGNWVDPAFSLAWRNLFTKKRFWLWPEHGLPDPRPFFIILPALWLDFIQERRGELFFLKWKLGWRAVLLAVALLVILAASGADNQVPFEYQGF